LLGSSALIAGVTLMPSSEALELPAGCIICGEHGGMDLILNLFLFVPFGFALAQVVGSGRRAIITAFFVSATVELLQLGIIPNRDANFTDVLSNTIGGATGVVLLSHWRRLLVPDRASALRLGASATLAWVCILFVSAWILRPAPSEAVWFGQRTPNLRQFERFSGSLLRAELNGRHVPPGPIHSDTLRELRDEFGEGTVWVDAAVLLRPGSGVRRLSPIVSVFDSDQREILVLGQRRDALHFRMRTNAALARVRSNTFVLPLAFPAWRPSVAANSESSSADGGDTIVIAARRVKGVVTLTASRGNGVTSRRYSLHVLMGWRSLSPFDITDESSVTAISFCWALILALIPAYWVAWRGTSSWLVAQGVVVAATLAFGPGVFGVYSTPWWGWLASASGLVAGWLLGFHAVRRAAAGVRKVTP
jgi:hypothetical protein